MTRAPRLTDADLEAIAALLAAPHPEGLSMTAFGAERLMAARRLIAEVYRMRPARKASK